MTRVLLLFFHHKLKWVHLYCVLSIIWFYTGREAVAWYDHLQSKGISFVPHHLSASKLSLIADILVWFMTVIIQKSILHLEKSFSLASGGHSRLDWKTQGRYSQDNWHFGWLLGFSDGKKNHLCEHSGGNLGRTATSSEVISNFGV